MQAKDKIAPFSSFSILIVFVLLGIVGAALIPLLSIQLMPKTSFASVTVSASLPGASAEVAELELTTPLEGALSRLKGVTKISSTTSINGYSSIRLELDKFTDPAMFRFEAASMLRQLRGQLPANATYPTVALNVPNASLQNETLLRFTFHGPGSINELYAIADKELRTAMGKIRGIYQFEVTGGLKEQIAIEVLPERLRESGISLGQFESSVRDALGSQELGLALTESGNYMLRFASPIEDANQLATIPLIQKEGRILQIRDLARIDTILPIPYGFSRINGQEIVQLSFKAEEQVNTIELASTIRTQLAETVEALGGGYSLQLVHDSTKVINEELNKIYLRTGLSVFILLLFVILITRSVRYLLIVMISLLANVLLAFICYYLFGLDIHLYSLAGITISLGLIIDNVIVIVEDLRHTGRNRIFAAILASTLTAIGALSVVFMLEASQLVRLYDFAIAIILNLLVSLPIAYYFIPALLEQMPIRIRKSAMMIRRRRRLVKWSKAYQRQLRFMLRWRWTFFLLFILSFGLPLFLLPEKIEDNKETWWGKAYNTTLGSKFYTSKLRDPINKYTGGMLYYYIRNTKTYYYRPPEEGKITRLNVHITLPTGGTLAQLDEITRNFEQYILAYQSELQVFNAQVNGGTSASINIEFKPDHSPVSPWRLKQELESKAIYAGAADFSVTGVGQVFNNAINTESFQGSIGLKGYNLQQLLGLAEQVRDTLMQNRRIEDVMISTDGGSYYGYNQRRNVEHVSRIVRPEYLTLNKIGSGDLSRALSLTSPSTNRLGYLQGRDDQTMDVSAHYQYENPPGIWQTLKVPLQINDSTALRMDDVSQTELVRISQQISREDQSYIVHVRYRFIGSYELQNLLIKRVRQSVEPLLPFGYSWVEPSWWTPPTAATYFHFIGLVLLIIYMICAVLLESFKQPIYVLLMIPFSFIGVLIIYYLLDIRFDEGGYAALLLLCGLVTNAALYIINDLNFMSGRVGYQQLQYNIRHFIRAFNAKAMPVLITTASAVLSLLPFMLTGEETGFWFTLSAGTIGGLLFSLLGVYLLLPLCLLPAIRKRTKKPKTS
jgi:multidrug efflux pump subunit AcrB